jgi:hypothetical protein
LSISEAGTRSRAHVTVYKRVGGLLWHRTGALEVIPDERAPWTLHCGVTGGGDTFTLSPESFDEAHLHTIDGADYYALRLLLTCFGISGPLGARSIASRPTCGCSVISSS